MVTCVLLPKVLAAGARQDLVYDVGLMVFFFLL